MGGDVILDKLGLPSMFGDDYGMVNQFDPDVPEPTGSTQLAAPVTPTAVSDETLEAREAQRKRQMALSGLSGSVLTSSSGLSSGANTGTKSLLGS